MFYVDINGWLDESGHGTLAEAIEDAEYSLDYLKGWNSDCTTCTVEVVDDEGVVHWRNGIACTCDVCRDPDVAQRDPCA